MQPDPAKGSRGGAGAARDPAGDEEEMLCESRVPARGRCADLIHHPDLHVRC